MKLHHTLLIPLLVVAATISGCKEEPKIEYVNVGENWESLYKLRQHDNAFEVTGQVKSSYKIKERIEMVATSAEKGNLWIVQVDPNDNLTLLFPNKLTPNTKIDAGETRSLPGEQAEWEIFADKPTGKSVVAFIVTSKNTTLGTVLHGKAKDAFPKALELMRDDPAWGIDVKVVDIFE